jgi:hypothetical protein
MPTLPSCVCVRCVRAVQQKFFREASRGFCAQHIGGMNFNAAAASSDGEDVAGAGASSWKRSVSRSDLPKPAAFFVGGVSSSLLVSAFPSHGAVTSRRLVALMDPSKSWVGRWQGICTTRAHATAERPLPREPAANPRRAARAPDRTLFVCATAARPSCPQPSCTRAATRSRCTATSRTSTWASSKRTASPTRQTRRTTDA